MEQEERIMAEWTFKRDTAFRKQFFVPNSFAHPAKMDAQLLIKIVEEYTSPGETILDPMAGSGTLMLACVLGRNVVLVELEKKFCQMMRANWEKVRMRPMMGYEMGDCEIIQGDARQLENILCNKIITSPHGGIDSIVTSPPYGGTISRQGGESKIDDIGISCQEIRIYSDNSNNLGNFSYGNIDSIITSPPYEGSMDGGSRHTKGGIPERDKAMRRIGSYDTTNRANIGNLYKDTYLEAMALVYSQCYKVLKPQGLMVLIIKNFIRNKKEIDLRGDTVRLCECVGFQFLEEHHRVLPGQSFWRTIYRRRHPDAPVIDREYILVFRR